MLRYLRQTYTIKTAEDCIYVDSWKK